MSIMNPAHHAYVLDDDAQVGTIICNGLVASGYLPRQFTTTAPFFSAVETQPPEVVVLDLALGQSDAIDVMRRLEALRYHGKVLLVSGRGEIVLDEVKQIGERHGLAMLPSLQKPFRIHELKERLAAPASEMSPRATVIDAETRIARRIAVDVTEAQSNGWLEVWYQPKIDLKTMAICGAEALLRLRHPQHGILFPADFMPPPADPRHLPLSQFVFGRAIADWTHLARGNMQFKLAINVPVSVLLTPQFIACVREMQSDNHILPNVIIEITEDEIIQDANSIREVATQLKLYGLRLSIDDFGTAYSSLSRLHEMPFMELKLDRSFISRCSLEGAKQSVCTAAIELGHGFGATVCAEGVEAVNDLKTLIAMRCDTAQGYLFAKPMPADQFLKLSSESIARSVQAKMDTGAVGRSEYRGSIESAA